MVFDSLSQLFQLEVNWKKLILTQKSPKIWVKSTNIHCQWFQEGSWINWYNSGNIWATKMLFTSKLVRILREFHWNHQNCPKMHICATLAQCTSHLNWIVKLCIFVIMPMNGSRNKTSPTSLKCLIPNCDGTFNQQLAFQIHFQAWMHWNSFVAGEGHF